jgi:hypothetical protein
MNMIGEPNIVQYNQRARTSHDRCSQCRLGPLCLGVKASPSTMAALESIVLTTRAALNRAPADPVINGYHLTAVAEREAMLRRLAAATADESRPPLRRIPTGTSGR